MSRCVLYLSVSLLFYLLSGCSAPTKEEMTNPADQELITSKNMDRITGMQWILQKMTVEGQDYLLTREKPYIKFETGGKVSGFSSVNRYFGSIQLSEEGDIKWSPIGSTRMAGLEDMMKQEGSLLNSILIQMKSGNRYA